MSQVRTPVPTPIPAPPSPRTNSPLRGAGSTPSTQRSAAYRPFTALSRDRDRGTLSRAPGTPTASPFADGGSFSAVSESPTQQRLLQLQGRLQTQSVSESARKAMNEKEKESKLVMLDDKLSVLLAGQEAERKRLERDESVKTRDTDDRVVQLEKMLQQLQHDFESEEQTRKTLNSTFAKNFAIKIEERFIKMEALVSSQKRQLAESEEARVRMMVSFESRLSELSQKLEQDRSGRLQRNQEDDENWKRVTAAIDRLDRVVDEAGKSSSAREEGVWGRVSQEINAVRSQMDQERAVRERDDEQKMQLINEGIAFIKDGKETWLRMFDYKMMPFKMQREEDEVREQKRSKEQEQRIADLQSKIQLLESTVEEERRVREDEIACLTEELVKEGKTRESTEEQISRLLEHTINRFDELRD